MVSDGKSGGLEVDALRSVDAIPIGQFIACGQNWLGIKLGQLLLAGKTVVCELAARRP
jgi:hypothetical protein